MRRICPRGGSGRQRKKHGEETDPKPWENGLLALKQDHTFSLTGWLEELNKIKHAKTLSSAISPIVSDQYIEFTSIILLLEELILWQGWEQGRLGETHPRSWGFHLLIWFEAWTLQTSLSEFLWPWKMWFKVDPNAQKWCLYLGVTSVVAGPRGALWALSRLKGGRGGSRNSQKSSSGRTLLEGLGSLASSLWVLFLGVG